MMGVQIIPANRVIRLDTKKSIVGESARWLPREKRLIHVDILGKELRSYDPSGGREECWSLPQVTGFCCETSTAGTVLLGGEDGLSLFELSSGQSTLWCPIEEDEKATRMNDGRCDQKGRLWISTMDMVEMPRRPIGSLYRVGADGTVTRKKGGLRVPNTLAFSPDCRTAYFADSPSRLIWQYDYDPDAGEMTGERIFCAFGDDEKGMPDGAAMDTDGCLWFAVPQGGRIERRRPDGTLDTLIEMPVERPTMCAFGGPELDMMFITTLSRHLTPEERENDLLNGALFAVRTGHKGIPETPFAAGNLL